MAGDGNADVQSNIQRVQRHYDVCLQITAIINELTSSADPYFYLYRAAEKGLAVAQYGLATAYPPDGYSSWEEERKEEHRETMGKLLEEARSQCEPRAFQAFAAGKRMGEGDLWRDPNPVPDNIREYANNLAFGIFFANKVVDGEVTVAQTGGDLKRIRAQMTAEEIEQAEQYGRYLYDINCR